MNKKLLCLLIVFVFSGATYVNAVRLKPKAANVPRQEGSGRTLSRLAPGVNTQQVYCAALNDIDCAFGEYISNVKILTTPLNQSGYCDSSNLVSNYISYPVSSNTTANLTRNVSYDFVITMSFDAIASIWIDYNLNGTFEASEWTQVCTTSVMNVPDTVSILIPASATVGAAGFRIRTREATYANGPADACTDFFSGETEDYIVGIETNVGVSKLDPKKGFTVYPNPSKGMLSVFPGGSTENTVISMYDVLGNLVITESMQSSYRKDLDISALSNGIYFLQVQRGNQLMTERIILDK